MYELIKPEDKEIKKATASMSRGYGRVLSALRNMKKK